MSNPFAGYGIAHSETQAKWKGLPSQNPFSLEKVYEHMLAP
jgi:hypothetical protein